MVKHKLEGQQDDFHAKHQDFDFVLGLLWVVWFNMLLPQINNLTIKNYRNQQLLILF